MDVVSATLHVMQGALSQKEFPIGSEPLHVGRDTGGAAAPPGLRIADPHISHHHCQITCDGDDYFVTDMDSMNGTWVNDIRLDPHIPHRLRNHDLIKLAKGIVILRFENLSATRLLEHQLVIFFEKREVWIDDQKLDPPLSLQQLKVLYYLYQNAHRLCTKDEIADAGWSVPDGGVTPDMIYQTIKNIRGRLKTLFAEHDYIRTVGTHGYRFEQPR